MIQHPVHTLLAAPDQEWPSLLYGQLWQNGFAPLTIAPDSRTALLLFRRLTPRLVVLDCALPNGDALELCVEMLREAPTTKIVLVTDDDAQVPPDVVHVGVSACVSRSLSLAAWPGLLDFVLNDGTAFASNVVKKIMAASGPSSKPHWQVEIGPLQIDLTQNLTSYGGQRILLTPREFALLACLTHHLGHVVTFDQLLNEAWGYNSSEGTPAQVRLYIARLRNKFEKIAPATDFILTERGIGYRLNQVALGKGEKLVEPLSPEMKPEMHASRALRPAKWMRLHPIATPMPKVTVPAAQSSLTTLMERSRAYPE